MDKESKVHKIRRRGVILSTIGFDKLYIARTRMELDKNAGKRYTLDDLGNLTNLSVDTLTKVFDREIGVDKRTLKRCFRAFDLTLDPDDYCYPQQQFNSLGKEPELPGGKMSLASPFYIDRFPIESECYQAIVQPGALIRIKAARGMGKTSLMERIIAHGASHDYQTLSLSFQLIDKSIFQNLDKFLQWFCLNVGLALKLPSRLPELWNNLFGSKVSCKIYFENYLLAQLQRPLVLALDDIDGIFNYADLADDFFGLLRTWHEDAKNQQIWQQLRLILIHSTEVYLPLNSQKSPFNVGLSINLPELTLAQVKSLVQIYGLGMSTKEVEELVFLVGGNPYLVQLSLYHIWHNHVTLKELLQVSPSCPGIYGDHLQRQLWSLQQHPELATAFTHVVKSAHPVELDLVEAFKLQSMGLIHLQGNQAVPNCLLYQKYFSDFNS